jgi:hypothetical protein
MGKLIKKEKVVLRSIRLIGLVFALLVFSIYVLKMPMTVAYFTHSSSSNIYEVVFNRNN